MAIKHLVEPLNNGVVTARDPFYLAPGELRSGQYCYFSVSDEMVLKVPAIGTALASASACNGLQHIVFTSSEMLLTHGAGAYYKAPITSIDGALGALTAVVTGLTVTSIPNTFSAIQYNNKYILLDGLNTPQVLRSDSTVRRLGLMPVITKVRAATATAGANTWPGRAVGYFDYWYTEVAEYGTSPEDIIVESAYEATVNNESTGTASINTTNAITTNGRPIKIDVACVNVLTLATLVNVDLPMVPRNPTTTHYYVYRSLPKDYEVEPSFPIGEKIARVAIPTSATDPVVVDGLIRVIDGAVTTSGPFYTSTYVTSTNSDGTSWTNPANAAADNSTEYSDGTVARFTVPTGTSTYSTNQLIVSTMSATGIYDPVAQIRVTFRARLQGGFTGAGYGTTANLRISGNAGSSWSSVQAVSVTGTSYGDYATPWTNWGNPYLSTNDVANANFRVRLDFSGYRPSVIAGTGYVDVDGIKVEIKHNGTVPVPIGAYPGIVIQIGQDKFVSSKGGEPPISSLGCIYQGSLVTNDVGTKNMIRWSMPGEIDAFPSLYFFPISPPTGSSEITYIGVVNNVCIIGLKNSIVRVNYLPSENDSNFTRDRIYDFITTDVGIFNKNAACVYRNQDGREVLAVLTPDGIYITDGFSIHKVSNDYNFGTIVSSFMLSSISMYDVGKLSLVSETQTQNLILMYNYSNAAYLTTFNYSTRHIKDGGQLKVGGLWPAGSDYKVILPIRTLSGYPIVYFLNAAYAIKQLKPLGGNGASTGALSLSTRRICPSNPPHEFEVKQVYLYGDTLTSMVITGNAYRTEKNPSSTVVSTTTSAPSVIGKVSMNTSGEFVIFTIEGPESVVDNKIGHIVIEYDDQLNTESM